MIKVTHMLIRGKT